MRRILLCYLTGLLIRRTPIEVRPYYVITQPIVVLRAPEKQYHKILTLQNRNICKQDTENLSFSQSIILSILSLRNHQIFNRERIEPSEKV